MYIGTLVTLSPTTTPETPLQTNTRTDAMDSFSSFPSELIYMVAKYLDPPRDLCALIRSNRRMRDVLTPLLHMLAREDKDGKNALCWASLRGDRPLVLLLLESGFDINHESRRSESALACAVRRQHVSIVKLLLERGANANVILYPACSDEAMARDRRHIPFRRGNHYAALHRTAANGNIPILRLLLDHGARVNQIAGNTTALHAAIKNIRRHRPGHVSPEILARYTEVVKLLLERGANVNAQDFERRTALHLVAMEQHVAMTRTLIENMADIEATDRIGRTALHYAAINKNEAIVELLLEVGGSSIGCLDIGGRTPVDWAVKPVRKMASYVNCTEYAGLVRLLLKGRISIYLSTRPDGGRVLKWARLARCEDVMAMFALELA